MYDGNETDSLTGDGQSKHVACHISRLAISPLAFRNIENPEDLKSTVAWPCNPSNPTTGRVPWLINIPDASATRNKFVLSSAHRQKTFFDRKEDDSGGYSNRAPDRRSRFNLKPNGIPYESSSGSKKRFRNGWEEDDDYSKPSVSSHDKRARGSNHLNFGMERLNRGGDLTDSDKYNQDGYAHRIILRDNLITHLNYASKFTKNAIARIGAQLLCLSKITKHQWMNFVKEGLVIPDSYTYSAPFEETNMGSIMFAKSGSGKTGTGFEDMSIQYNATNKRWIGHWTAWMAALIGDPTTVWISKDTSFKGIVNGLDGSVNVDSKDFRPGMLKRHIKKTGFVFSLGPHTKEMPSPFWTLTGKIDPKVYNSNYPNANLETMFQWSGCLFYDILWGFSELNNNTIRDHSSFFSMQSSDHFNEVIPQARQKMWDARKGGYTKVIRGKGVLRNWEASNILAVFNGNLMGKEQDDNM